MFYPRHYDMKLGGSGCISALVVMLLIAGCVLLHASPNKPSLTIELVEAAHRVLDLGFDCAKSGTERIACHAQLTTAIKDRVK